MSLKMPNWRTFVVTNHPLREAANLHDLIGVSCAGVMILRS